MGAYYDENILDEISRRLDILDVVAESVKLSRKGDRYWGLCPFHDEKTPSFSVSPGKNMFYCFGCNCGGNLFTYIMKRDGLNFPEAVQKLAEQTGVQLQSPKMRRGADRFRKVVEVNQAATTLFRQFLRDGEKAAKARDYLGQRHLNEGIIDRFQLGYAPADWQALLNRLLEKGFEQEWIKESGLVKRSKNRDSYYDLFRDRIIFPILDYQGNAVGFGGRSLGDAVPKYLNTPETDVYVKRHHLFGLYQARETIRKCNEAILVEGYMDCLKLHQHGLCQTVASLGTAFTKEQSQLLRRYTENVMVLYDGDAAGQREALRAIDLMEEQGFNIDVLTLPVDQDPDDFLDEHGKEEFLQYIQNNRVSYIEFKMKRYIAVEDKLDLQAKIRVINGIKNDIGRLPSAILRDNYIKMLSRLLKIEENLILKEIDSNSGHKNTIYRNKRTVKRDNIKYGNYSLEEKILAAVLHNREIAETLSSQLGLECFGSGDFNRLATIYCESGGFIVESIQDEKLQSILARLDTLWDEGIRINDAELWYFIRSVQRQDQKARWRKLHQRLEYLHADGDFQTVLRLILDLDTFLHHTREGGIQ